MKRYLALVVGVAVLALAPAAIAASPHYIRGPDATVSGNSLTVSWKAAGLGNDESVDFTLTGTANVTSQCFTRSGNPVQGVPKSEQVDVNVTGEFPVRNGQVTRIAFGLAAVDAHLHRQPAGSHPGRFVDLFLNGDDLPEVHLTG